MILHGDDRANLSYFIASVLTALTPVIILAAIGWWVYRAYRKGARSGEEGPGKGKRETSADDPDARPDEWRYKG